MSKTDPRAEFAALDTNELRADLEVVEHRIQLVHQDLARMKPTRKEAEEKIEAAQARARKALDGPVTGEAFSHLSSASLGSIGWGKVEDVAVLHIVASDAFAETMKSHFAAKRRSETDLQPKRGELAALERRQKAIRAELELRKLDELRAAEDAKREAALDKLRSA